MREVYEIPLYETQTIQEDYTLVVVLFINNDINYLIDKALCILQ